MREVLGSLLDWWAAGEPAAVATVVATWNSAPRQPGAAMVVGPGGTVVGSVSGGCVEGAVYDLAGEIIASGRPQLVRYGVSDDTAESVGLTCGGTLDVYVERVDRGGFPEFGALAADVEEGRPVALATVITHPDASRVGRRLLVRASAQTDPGAMADRAAAHGALEAPPGVPVVGLGSARADAAVTDDARGLLAAGRTETLEYGPDGERRGEGMRVFVASYAPQPRMIVFGAIDFAAAVAEIGAFLGYAVTVCDARPIFATADRFPHADVVVDWPHRYLAAQHEAGRIDARTVVCVLTHDPKFDVPVLERALRMDLAYVGAMGSRRTHQDRVARLRDAGLSEPELARLASPIGLDLGARTPQETAVSIAAEIIALTWGGAGRRLGSIAGPIHHADPPIRPAAAGPTPENTPSDKDILTSRRRVVS